MRQKLPVLALLLMMGLLLAIAAPSLADQSTQPGVVAISSGCYGTYIALLDNGTVWAWGNNDCGQFGNGSITSCAFGENGDLGSIISSAYEQESMSAPVMASIDQVIEVSTAGGHTVALKDDGTVWEWGYLLNTPGGEYVLTPRQITGLPDIKHIFAGGADFAIDVDGVVWAWGDNYFGNFGNNESGKYVYPPVRIPIDHVKQISCGAGTALLKEDGTVWTAGYGDNGYGCCEGSENPPVQPEFRQVPITDVTAISSGSGFMLALKSDGTVWGWGDNTFYELGCYTQMNEQMTPVRVGGLTDVVAVSAGGVYGMALKKDGTVWTWGGNNAGYIRSGFDASVKIVDPVEVAKLDHIKAISAGPTPGIALKDDGTVWTWGSTNYITHDENELRARQIVIGTAAPETSTAPAATKVPASTQPADDGSYAEFKNNTVATFDFATSVNDTVRHIAFDGTGDIYALGDHTVSRLKADGELLWDLEIPFEWKINGRYWRPMFNYESTSTLLCITNNAVFDTGDGYLYLYLTPSQPYPNFDNHYDRSLSTEGLSWALMAISPDGKIEWTKSLPTDKEYVDSTTVQAIGDRIYLFHDYNETVLDKDGHVLFTIPDISDPAAVDEAGNLYVTRTTKKFMEAAGNGYSDYRLPSSVIEAYGPDGTLLWHKDMSENLYRQFIAEEVRARFSALPLYQDGTLYVPMKNGIVALDTNGSEKWSKRFSDGYYGLFYLMPLDEEGNVYVGYFGVSGQAPYPEKLYIISDDGKVTIGPRAYIYRYDGLNHPAAMSGIIYETEVKNVDYKPPLENLPCVTIRAYDIRNDTYLWSYWVAPSIINTTVVEKTDASYICRFVDPIYDDPARNADWVLGRNQPGELPVNGTMVWEYVSVTPGSDAIYVSLRALKYDYPVIIGQSKAAYTSGVYAFSLAGEPLVRTESGELTTAVAVNNSTVFFGGANGGISISTAATGIVAGIALFGALAIFAKFFLFGTVTRARSQLDKNENRNLVLAHIREHPGSTMYEISRGMGMNMGTVRYHVFILGINRKIAMFKDGKFVRYFPNSNFYSKEEQLIISLIRRETMGKIIQMLVVTPGLTNTELSKALEQPNSAISKLTKELCMRGIAVREEIGDERADGKFAFSIRTEFAEKTADLSHRLKNE